MHFQFFLLFIKVATSAKHHAGIYMYTVLLLDAIKQPLVRYVVISRQKINPNSNNMRISMLNDY